MYIPEAKLPDISRTALAICGFCAFVARHEPGRSIFHDPFADPLFRAAAKDGDALLDAMPDWSAVETWVANNQQMIDMAMVSHVIWRKRWMEDHIRRAISGGASQLVVLGSGLDTIALRLADDYPGLRIFEVDQPATIAAKEDLVGSIFGRPESTTYLPVDFETESWADCLMRAGYDRKTASVFIAEVVLEYVDPAGVDQVFRDIHARSGAGSIFLFTYFSAPALKRLYKSMADSFGEVDEPLRFMLQPGEIDGFLNERGFRLTDQLSPEGLLENYLATIGLPPATIGLQDFDPQDSPLHMVKAEPVRPL